MTAETSDPPPPREALSGQERDMLLDRTRQLLCDELGFLVESRLMYQLEQLADPEQKKQLKISSILNMMGITEYDDFVALMQYFQAAKDPAPAPEEKPTPAPSTIGASDIYSTQTKSLTPADFVSPERAVSAISAFLHEHKKQVDTNHQQSTSVQAALRAHQTNEERDFWERLSEIVSPHSLGVWTHLERCLVRYNTLLNSRANLLQETAFLQQQNEELQALLGQYMYAPINDDLQISPAQAIEAQLASLGTL
eukprot:gnl/Spiro4/7728_TR4069_c0_g1_i1.p1 gnl/Spiro4/7728_TR4069_c0_g1~~gnl/Spiro4/7728_TR4069_c0_g1_i1.p1  ORF type:complete len:274 (+),score=118.19 gnl/Spiro4/7728_TR4069_c0_g1_i1:66-824(+)